MDTIKIGQLARNAGVNVETIRYYQRRGLLAQPDNRKAATGITDRARCSGCNLSSVRNILVFRSRKYGTW